MKRRERKKMKNNSKSVKVPMEFSNFLNQVENNMRKQMGLSPYIAERVKLKSEIQRRIPLIFQENPNMMKKLIELNKRRNGKNIL